MTKRKWGTILATPLLATFAFHSLTARAEAPNPPPQSNATDLTPKALQDASALIEQYVQPVAEPEPTPQEKLAIQSAISLLESQEALKGQHAIESFLNIGPAALGDLRRLAASAPPETAPGETPTGDAYPATMAAIIIRRIESAQRGPILQQLIPLGDAARVALSRKLKECESAVADAETRVEAATGALVQAEAGSGTDAPAIAGQRQALSEAQAVQKQVLTRHERLIEVRRLMAQKPPAPAPVQTAQAPAANAPQVQSNGAGSSSPQPAQTPASSPDNSYADWFNSAWQNSNGILIPPPPPSTVIVNGRPTIVIPGPSSKH